MGALSIKPYIQILWLDWYNHHNFKRIRTIIAKIDGTVIITRGAFYEHQES